MRFIYGWSLKPLIYLALAPVLAVTIYCALDPDLRVTLGLAWDAGAVTTGPVTVPLVLSLGIGIASAAGKSESGLSGFGIVTLASLFPILGVMLLLSYLFGFLNDEKLPARLLRALKREALEVHYQPIVRLASGRCAGVEALARWTDSSLGRVSPDVFIGALEESGDIELLTRFVLPFMGPFADNVGSNATDDESYSSCPE